MKTSLFVRSRSRREVMLIAHIGITDPGRNADYSGRSGKQRRLTDAETATRGQNAAGAIGLLIENVDIRVVDDTVPNRAIEPKDAIDVVAQPCCHAMRELYNRARIAVDKATGCKQFAHGYVLR
jgi:hypothetical protein